MNEAPTETADVDRNVGADCNEAATGRIVRPLRLVFKGDRNELE